MVCLSVRLVHVAIYALHLVAHTTPHPSRTCWLLLVDERALRTIRHTILMLTTDRGKVIELRDRITTNRLPASLQFAGQTSPCSSFIRPASAPPHHR